MSESICSPIDRGCYNDGSSPDPFVQERSPSRDLSEPSEFEETHEREQSIPSEFDKSSSREMSPWHPQGVNEGHSATRPGVVNLNDIMHAFQSHLNQQQEDTARMAAVVNFIMRSAESPNMPVSLTPSDHSAALGYLSSYLPVSIAAASLERNHRSNSEIPYSLPQIPNLNEQNHRLVLVFEVCHHFNGADRTGRLSSDISGCSYEPCRYHHICAKCSQPGHGYLKCPQRLRPGDMR